MIVVWMQVVKNKCAPPFKAAEFDIMFGSGISSLGCLLDAAEGVGIVQRKGAWYSFGEQRIGQGREKSMATLASDAALAKYAAVKCLGASLDSAMNVNVHTYCIVWQFQGHCRSI